MTWDSAAESIAAWMERARLGSLTGNVGLNNYLNFNAQLL